MGQTIFLCRVFQKPGDGVDVVHEAVDTSLNREVGPKSYLPFLITHPDAHLRFVREKQAASARDHPDNCTIQEIGRSDGGMFVVIRYCEGKTPKERPPLSYFWKPGSRMVPVESTPNRSETIEHQ